jgi:hypothetical protein
MQQIINWIQENPLLSGLLIAIFAFIIYKYIYKPKMENMTTGQGLREYGYEFNKSDIMWPHWKKGPIDFTEYYKKKNE